jgi:hypothetical protein
MGFREEQEMSLMWNGSILGESMNHMYIKYIMFKALPNETLPV